MTNKEKKEYLYRYRNLQNSIKRLMEEKEHWQTRAEKITPTISDMPRCGDEENQRELAICNMIDCEIEITRLIDQLCDLRKIVKHYISTTADADERLLAVLKTE